MTDKIVKSDAEWQAQLTPDQYYVARKHGTERPFTHEFNGLKGAGTFTCVACGQPLFDARDKFDSGTGWPSFTQPIAAEAVEEHTDRKLFMKRTEIRCARCDAHLGHVFPDGPAPTGLRYCMNGVVLDLKPADGAS